MLHLSLDVVRRALAIGALVAAGILLWPIVGELTRDWPAWLQPRSPRDRYVGELREAGLHLTDAGDGWLAAAERVLSAPSDTPPVVRRSGVLGDGGREAHAWRFSVRRGRRLTINVAFGRGRLFIDLFDGDSGDRIASAPAGSTTLVYEVRKDLTAIARVQSELSARGPFEVVQRAEATLLFPIPGATIRQVRSTFGDPRDAGARRHEGIDIFAPRGTPVVAATDGWITPNTSNRLGGNVVWLWSLTPPIAVYYAHLERHAVAPGERVRAGEVVGYVGNTGNARGTAPHLHFGIYTAPTGAVDPLPFVCDAPCGERVMHSANANRRAP